MTPGGSSKDPAARGRSIANLRRGGQTPDGSQRVTHGAFRRVVDAGDRDAKARTIFDALAADAPLRDPSGELPAADAVTVKLLADALVRLDDSRTTCAGAAWRTRRASCASRPWSGGCRRRRRTSRTGSG